MDAKVKVLLKLVPPSFAFDIERSELLSRGWVFQEVRLTPANLFCAEDQTWWCCLEASCCETYPRPGKDQFAKYFKDLLRGDHLFLTSPEESIVPMERWLALLELYSATSVTDKSDRVVAIMGLVERLRELYRLPFQDSMYHSGMWSTDIVRQLLWKGHNRRMVPKSRFTSTTHPIPTWSPFTYDGEIMHPCIFTRIGSFLAVKCVKFPQSDHLGRAETIDEGMLHLSGVLVTMEFSTNDSISDALGTDVTEAHPKGYPDVVVEIHWDSVEDKEKSGASPSDHRALVCVYDPGRLGGPYGILLRPCNQQANRTQDWVRSGFIEPPFRLRRVGSEATVKAAFSLGSHEVEDIYIY